MNRRSFLRLLGAAGVVSAAPTYFLPPIRGWKTTGRHYDLLIQDDLVDHQHLVTSYYTQYLIEQLKRQSPFLVMSKQIPLPLRSGNEIQFFRYKIGEAS